MNKHISRFTPTLFLLFLFGVIFSQRKDTLFIKNDTHQKIYIDGENSPYYKDLSNFRDFKNFKGDKIKKLGLNNEWIRIYKYKGKYILYAPCDWSADTKIIISNGNLQIRNFETIVYKITSIKKLKEGHYKIQYSDNDGLKNSMEIKPINYKKRIFEFTIKSQDYIETFCMLYAKNIKEYNILINDCLHDRAAEFEFDKK